MHKTELAEHLFVVADLFSAEECRQLIERGEGLGFVPAAVKTHTGLKLLPEVRNNERVEFVDDALAETLRERCFPFVPALLDGGVPDSCDPTFRYYRYDVGQSFKIHKDGTVVRSPFVRSRLTGLVYLNDGFDGGETVFHIRDPLTGEMREVVRVVPRTGLGLFFLHEWRHEGRSLTSGRKYVLRSDIFYRFPGG